MRERRSYKLVVQPLLQFSTAYKTPSIALWLITAWLGGCAGAGPALTSIEPTREAVPEVTLSPSTIPSSNAVPADLEAIRAQIRANGSARVIAQLNVAFTPEGDLPNAAAIDQQRAAIAKAQADVLAGLSDYNVTVVYQSPFTPSIILVIDEARLDWLAQSPLVSDIQMDAAVPPASPSL